MPATLPLERAKMAYMERRRRDNDMRELQIFGEPAWDILLAIFIGSQEGGDVLDHGLLEAASVPQTTAIRWLDILENKELIYQVPARREKATKIFLTSKGHDLMLAFFSFENFH